MGAISVHYEVRMMMWNEITARNEWLRQTSTGYNAILYLKGSRFHRFSNFTNVHENKPLTKTYEILTKITWNKKRNDGDYIINRLIICWSAVTETKNVSKILAEKSPKFYFWVTVNFEPRTTIGLSGWSWMVSWRTSDRTEITLAPKACKCGRHGYWEEHRTGFSVNTARKVLIPQTRSQLFAKKPKLLRFNCHLKEGRHLSSTGRPWRNKAVLV